MSQPWMRWLAWFGVMLVFAFLAIEVDAQRRGGGRGGGGRSISRTGGARGGAMHRPSGSHRQRSRTSPSRSTGSGRVSRNGTATRGWLGGRGANSSVSRDSKDVRRRTREKLGNARGGREGGEASSRQRRVDDLERKLDDTRAGREPGETPTREQRIEDLKGKIAETPPGERPERPPSEREQAREDRQTHLEDQQKKRQQYANIVREDREEFVEDYGLPYPYGYYGPYYGYPPGGSSVYISISTYSSTSCTKQTVVVDGHTYYRCGSDWYDRVFHEDEVKYIAVPVPSGAEMADLPSDHQVFEAGGETYHVNNGSFYKEIRKDGKVRYIGVDPPFGLKTREKPDGATAFGMNGKSYLQAGSIFFRVESDAKGDSYTVIKPPY